jgi:gliding motility-associated-like protein
MIHSLRTLLLFLLLLAAGRSWATHNQAGEILVCHVGGLTYSVTIVTHTNPASPADRPEFVLEWGDGDIDTIPRQSANVITVAGIQVQRNVYVAEHTYWGPGIYTLQYIDPNRVAGVVNIPGSVNVPMCVQSQIIVIPNGNDCLPQFLNPPLQNACLGVCWEHNPGAYDVDGDSLSYELRPCLGYDTSEPPDGYGDPIEGYLFPDQVQPGANNQYSIDPVTGTITWCSPQEQGIYNIAFAVIEWRNGVQIGWVGRDMQVIVGACDDEPPVVAEVLDTCVLAGTTLIQGVQASDPDFGQTLTLTAFGGPFQVNSSPATFSSSPQANNVFGTFNWNTNCSHVRQQPYQVNFRASDNYNPQLQDYESMFITVVAPAPENPTATPNGSIMELAWDASPCSNAIGYKIYRRQGLYNFDPDACETGVPGYTGYGLIGQTTGLNNTSYNDLGLSFGITYCYMVVACFADSAQSYASVEFCNFLERDVPIMTHVSVVSTDESTGVDSVIWSNAFDLDTIQWPGPYLFKLYAGDGYTTANTLIHTTGTSDFLQHSDTAFEHVNLDTRNTAHVYRVELYGASGDALIGSSNTASSVFLVPEPNDEQITLNMTHSTPWINTQYEVYRETAPDVWTLIGTTTTDVYVDTALVNGTEYCYKAKSIGAYNDPSIVSPLINWSQEVCASPVDLTPPCPPTLALDNDCETPLNTLTWNNPNESCANDTWQYHIWFSDSLGGPLQVIATLTGAEVTEFLHTDGLSVAGCYAVSAIDSVGNESALSNTECGDNCPIYTLPNVFTPNNDQQNDRFIPFPYRGVKEIDLQVFNRWGQLVFNSTDPAILWPGTLKDGTEPVPDGVYFYTCTVNLIRLSGVEVKLLNGYVHIMRGSSGSFN